MKNNSYGTWVSPIDTHAVVAGGVSLSNICLDGDDIYWLERRPEEGGRSVLVRYKSGICADITPKNTNVRSRANEYGGGACTVHQGEVWFCNDEDQKILRLSGDCLECISPDENLRFADIQVDTQRQQLICVCEDHRHNSHEPPQSLISLSFTGKHRVLVSGADFYSTPRISPDGSQLAWLSWDHPNMPWDTTTLWRADLDEHGAISNQRIVAGGDQESIFQPEWSADNTLHFVSDRNDWWNLYRFNNDKIEAVHTLKAEFGRPQWVFGMTTYGFSNPPEHATEIITCLTQNGLWSLAKINATGLLPIALAYNDIQDIQVNAQHTVILAASPLLSPSIVRIDNHNGAITVLRDTSPKDLDKAYLSIPEPIRFDSGDRHAHALYYPPCNPKYHADNNERPPLLVKIHGGPTAMASTGLNLQIQYWTSRGFGLVDVNYGGSTGYGRPYRQRLHKQAGIVDVEDCINAAKHLIKTDRVDPERCAIRGSSAGGYTALAALTFHDFFKAGASYYGISDLSALAQETHKFESHYIDTLVAPWPEGKAIYDERSPIKHTDQLSVPTIFFQGLDDKIVPPNQAKMLVDALKRKGVPVAYLTFEGESHGFRRADSIKTTLDAELTFYGKIFGFNPANKGPNLFDWP